MRIDVVKNASISQGVQKSVKNENKPAGLNANTGSLNGLSYLGALNASMINFKAGVSMPWTLHPLELQLFQNMHAKTPEHVIKNPFSSLLEINNKGDVVFKLTKERVEEYDSIKNPKGLGLKKWLTDYAKTAKVSTAGIRGVQNILYPWDTSNQLNSIGMLIATTAKALVAKDLHEGKDLHKIAGGEVRYNTDQYLDIIARTQAAHGITTHLPKDRETIPIWLASFLAYKLDLLGGEYVTASHGASLKTATKDLNDQGSQYLETESEKFVQKMYEIYDQVEKTGSYELKLAPANHPLIKEGSIPNNGIDLYVEYLRDGVASKSNVDLIKEAKNPMYIECVGGSAYKTLSKVLKQLDVNDKYEWFNTKEDPFFHGIGKSAFNPKDGKREFHDYGVDASIINRDDEGKVSMPVIESLGYDKKLEKAPLGTVIFITDPDHDRFCLAQIENSKRIPELNRAGVDYIALGGKNSGKVLTVYTPNQSFLLAMDFHMKQLKKEGKWENHPRFIIKTTSSAASWDEWAKANDVKVINTPVGFKDMANIMKKVEKQISENPEKDVVVRDVFGKEINLGVNPRLVLAGEESGGMIMGPEKLIESKAGRKAIAMREKSATEAIVISSALVSECEKKGITLSNNLQTIFEKNKIKSKYDIRKDISYYNESEFDKVKRDKEKKAGIEKRTMNDNFYLSLAMGIRKGELTFEQGKEVLQNTVFKEKEKDKDINLDFSDLKDIKFVGDGTYLEFANKYVEIRPSGTDAITKAYGAGDNKEECIKFATAMGNYSGKRTDLHKKYINSEFYDKVKDIAKKDYDVWAEEGASQDKFVPPDYSKTAPELVTA